MYLYETLCLCSVRVHIHIFNVGLDRYRAGAQYPILSAAAAPIPIPVPIPILEMTSHIAWGMHMLHTLCTFQNIASLTLCFQTYVRYAYAGIAC